MKCQKKFLPELPPIEDSAPLFLVNVAKIIVLFIFLLFLLFISTRNAYAYTETFYLSASGDASAPETVAGAFDASDFNNAANWDTDDEDDGKIGLNDLVIVLDDDGILKSCLKPQQSGASGTPITIQGETGGTAEVWAIWHNSKEYITVLDLSITGSIWAYNSWDVRRCFVSKENCMCFKSTGTSIDVAIETQNTPTRLWVFHDGTTSAADDPGTINFGTSANRHHVVCVDNNDANLVRVLFQGSTGTYFDLTQFEKFNPTTWLRFNNTSAFGDLSSLSDIQSTIIYAYSTNITGNLSSLAGLTSTITFYLSSTAIEGDLSSISALTQLENLFLQFTSCTGSLSDVAGLTVLTNLWINNTAIAGNLSSLSACAALKTFHAESSSVVGDIASLSFMAVANTTIDLADCTGVYGDLADFTGDNIKELDISGTGITAYTASSLPFTIEETNTIINVADLSLSETQISNFICHLQATGSTNGNLDTTGNAAPNSAAETCIDDLRTDGWTVTVEGGY